MTFTEFVGFYGLARSEGLVLRYLADAYKAMRQTVPEEARTEELADLIEWLGETVRQVDRSLIDEWEKLRNPVAEAEHLAADRPPAVTTNKRAFRVLVRNALFRRVELAALRRWDDLGELDAADGWDADAWADALEPYFDEHDEIGTGANARGAGHADHRGTARTSGGSGRSSTTPRATTTGASRPRWTCGARTRPARP